MVNVLFNKKNILQLDIVENDNDYIVNKYDMIEKIYVIVLNYNLFEFQILVNFI